MNIRTVLRRNKTAVKTVIGVLIIFAVIIASYPYGQTTETVKVEKTIDGDTFKAEMNGETQSIRLKHVDTPETSGYNTPAEFKGLEQSDWKCLENYGYRAKKFTQKALDGEVSLTYREGILVVERGGFGRILAEVNTDNGSLGHELVRKGLARSYTERYSELEKKARKEDRGLWSCSG